MTIRALTGTEQPAQVIQRPRLLARVMGWELRRFCASRLFWFQAFGFWGFLLLIVWALHASDQTAPVHISRHPISRKKGQQEGQDDQIGGQSPQQPSCAGPSNVGAELYAARDRTSLI